MESNRPLPEWLNFHHLRYFHAVAREGSVRRAAARLHASQSSVCAQVKQLEAALGETLYRRSGRSIELTDFGQLVYGYAEEIVELGRELLITAKRVPANRILQFHVGIVDSFPKLLSLDILRPVFAQSPPVLISCREGKMEELLAQLALHRLDALLSDEPAPSSARFKAFTHRLGASGVTFCAAPSLAQKLSGPFPGNLHGAPALLPAQGSSLRRDVERWFRAVRVEPVVVGEFDDPALGKVVASEGIGITLVPTVVEAEASARYGLMAVGRTEECRIELYLIAAERRIEHPCIAVLVREGGCARRKQASRAAQPAGAAVAEGEDRSREGVGVGTGSAKPGPERGKAGKAKEKVPFAGGEFGHGGGVRRGEVSG